MGTCVTNQQFSEGRQDQDKPLDVGGRGWGVGRKVIFEDRDLLTAT